MNQSLINLEVRIENLTLRLSHEIRSASISPASSKAVNSNIYQSINNDTQNALIYPSGSDGALSLEDKLRKRVLEDLLQQSQQSRVITPNPPESGEITVKKTIVERLLEELNETKTSTDENTPSNVENTGDFISLSDYINKIMRDEAQ